VLQQQGRRITVRELPLPRPTLGYLILTRLSVDGVTMTKRAVDETFAALFALTDIRFVFREAKPLFAYTEEQKEKVRMALERVRRACDAIEKEVL